MPVIIPAHPTPSAARGGGNDPALASCSCRPCGLWFVVCVRFSVGLRLRLHDAAASQLIGGAFALWVSVGWIVSPTLGLGTTLVGIAYSGRCLGLAKVAALRLSFDGVECRPRALLG